MLHGRYLFPAVLIALAAILWGTDSLVRYSVVSNIDSRVIVFFEHLFGLAIIAPLALFRHRNEVAKFNFGRDLFPSFILGVGGSCLGSIFYTKSIQEIGPSTATLFQMIQPVFVIMAAYVFLKEKGSARFFQFAIWVILNSILISLPDFNFGFNVSEGEFAPGVLFGLAAVAMWGFATVAGKYLLFNYSPMTVVFLRWLFGTASMATYLYITDVYIPWEILRSPAVLTELVFLGSCVGILAMTIYYYGLRHMPASISTFIELIYPLAGIFLPYLYFGSALSTVQIIGGVVLLCAMFLLVNVENMEGAAH
jgi:drug/metabolite transporter, DME family